MNYNFTYLIYAGFFLKDPPVSLEGSTTLPSSLSFAGSNGVYRFRPGGLAAMNVLGYWACELLAKILLLARKDPPLADFC